MHATFFGCFRGLFLRLFFKGTNSQCTNLAVYSGRLFMTRIDDVVYKFLRLTYNFDHFYFTWVVSHSIVLQNC